MTPREATRRDEIQSMMKMWKDDEAVHFRGLVRLDDFPRLDAFDRMLIDDCGRDGASAADWLLALECIFRRAEQQAPHKEEV